MTRRRSIRTRLTVGSIAGVLAVGALAAPAPSQALPAPGAPGTTTVDSAKFATPGGHGNFRWRYSSSKKNQCGIYPTGRSYTVRCAAKSPAADGEKSKYDAIEIGRRVRRTTMSDDDVYSGAKRLYPNQTIDVVGITCTAFGNATIACTKGGRSFEIVGGVAKR